MGNSIVVGKCVTTDTVSFLIDLSIASTTLRKGWL